MIKRADKRMQSTQDSNPDMMSVLNSLLDVNRDGSALDDVMGYLLKDLGRIAPQEPNPMALSMRNRAYRQGICFVIS